MAAVGWYFVSPPGSVVVSANYAYLAIAVAIAVGTLVICVDILAPRQKLAIFSGTLFGLLVGSLIAYALSFVVNLLVDNARSNVASLTGPAADLLKTYINLLVGVTACYLSISFILQTKDDFRFIIPYVEFAKATKGARPLLLDTSVLIDGRILDIVKTGLIDAQMIVPRFVLEELQLVADSHDKLKRNRGRRGIDVLAKLREDRRLDVVIYEATERGKERADVDQRLVNLAKELSGKVLTNDFNLNKVAQLRGVDVINLNDLATAMKPVVLPGEALRVRLQKPGDQPGQGVGYLDDGTMVVVEQGRSHIHEEVEFVVTSALQTSAGKMIFGRLGSGASHESADDDADAGAGEGRAGDGRTGEGRAGDARAAEPRAGDARAELRPTEARDDEPRPAGGKGGVAPRPTRRIESEPRHRPNQTRTSA